jgi:hypothetical protein
VEVNAGLWSIGMRELEVKRYLSDFPTTTDTTRSSLGISERLIRITVMVAFVAVLAVEAWLLWQVYHLF